MVNLTRIYTRTGDAGQTRLSDLSLTSKTDPRVQAYGDVDEANSVLGIVTTLEALPQPLMETLRTIQNELFDVGADLSNPVVPEPTWEPLRITQPSIDRLEAWCDEYSDDLASLASFILPGGTSSSAYLHLARTVVRRAERSAWAAALEYGLEDGEQQASGGLNPLAITYLNRLSDLLFILARVANSGHDVMWVPGKDREPAGERARKHRARIEAAQAETE
ncbi:MAG TPA: cob(I)yrinic acid a,c-diamide adenosyltransferase [Propioniciclava sp.]|mgnify:CR=1 FL=1|jgi:cob(I)alamin adenosyltransferase|uniref:cob(I)yrinic acid a,c-diamide adenosyltransferase n=1 Tax=Propioniciclava sp. TaxID=2038686 RepID=UPI002CEB0E98|nr:cob(I)yrinic acid a,c-diamide adenosyltransferase [Propioniciclava sp.]HRL48419.1 cob(I)yrinic acid a,c-diamide adenosyltransferase [Propioniciclava sp.]HRL80005.1 cob(I)yrinic acid a,c-diamide adenosyltransferase [Propioniciclava sp.]